MALVWNQWVKDSTKKRRWKHQSQFKIIIKRTKGKRWGCDTSSFLLYIYSREWEIDVTMKEQREEHQN